MQRRVVIISVLALAAIAATGALAWNAFFAVPEISGEVTAIPVGSGLQAEEVVAEPSATAVELDQGNSEPAGADGQVTYTVVVEESEVRFLIGEILFGEPKTVVGVNDQFAAQILIDFDNPQNSQVGVVTINARAFRTDSSNRNGQINNRILESGEFEFITFEPSEYIGLPESGAIGDSFEFQLVGDLTIRDITEEVTFDVTLTLESEERISGFASATIQLDDFELVVPQVPQVAGVDEEIILEFDFVALAD